MRETCFKGEGVMGKILNVTIAIVLKEPLYTNRCSVPVALKYYE